MTSYTLRAANNCSFQWTRDFSAVAAVYDLSTATVRMDFRRSPNDRGQAIYAFSSTNTADGVFTFDSSTGLGVFTAPEIDMSFMSGTMYFDSRLELASGEIVPLFEGKVIWRQGITRDPASSSSAATSGSVSGGSGALSGSTGFTFALSTGLAPFNVN